MSASTDPLARLSVREKEVLRLFLDGLSLKEIAGRLQVGTGSVVEYKRRLLRKLEISSDVQLVIYCVRAGIVDLQKKIA